MDMVHKGNGQELPHGLVSAISVAREGSFSGAARRLGLTVAAVSKAVSGLERELGTPLFVRTTRKVHPTQQGGRFLAVAERSLGELATAREELEAARSQPRGELRVTLSQILGSTLLPLLPEFHARYPRVRLRLRVTERKLDLVEEGIDVALRVGEPRDSELMMRSLFTPKWAMVASPGFIQRGSPILRVEDLEEREGLFFVSTQGKPRQPQLLDRAGVERPVSLSPVLEVDSGLMLLDAALAGLGIAQVFDFMARTHLEAGRLVELFPESAPKGPSVVALCPRARTKMAAISAFLDFIQQKVKSAEG